MLKPLLTALALVLVSPVMHAEDKWPSKPIKMITPFGAGSGTDLFARLYAADLAKSLGVPVIVDNKPGASGIIGTDAVAKAPADGYTLLYGFNQLVTMNPHLFSKLPYKTKDLQPLAQTVYGGYVLVANNGFAPKTLADVIALAKEKPGRVVYGSYGPGTVSNLTFELIGEASKAEFLQVPYKQGALTDVVGGQVPMLVETSLSAVPFVKTGKLHAIAVTTPKRLPALPDVPTIGETLPGVEVIGWQGIFAPVGLPPEVAARLSSEIVRITHLPATTAKIRELGAEPSDMPAAELPAAIEKESATWGALIKAKNIKLD